MYCTGPLYTFVYRQRCSASSELGYWWWWSVIIKSFVLPTLSVLFFSGYWLTTFPRICFFNNPPDIKCSIFASRLPVHPLPEWEGVSFWLLLFSHHSQLCSLFRGFLTRTLSRHHHRRYLFQHHQFTFYNAIHHCDRSHDWTKRQDKCSLCFHQIKYQPELCVNRCTSASSSKELHKIKTLQMCIDLMLRHKSQIKLGKSYCRNFSCILY